MRLAIRDSKTEHEDHQGGSANEKESTEQATAYSNKSTSSAQTNEVVDEEQHKEAVTEHPFATSSVNESTSDGIVEANEVVEEAMWECTTCGFPNQHYDGACCACGRERT